MHKTGKLGCITQSQLLKNHPLSEREEAMGWEGLWISHFTCSLKPVRHVTLPRCQEGAWEILIRLDHRPPAFPPSPSMLMRHLQLNPHLPRPCGSITRPTPPNHTFPRHLTCQTWQTRLLANLFEDTCSTWGMDMVFSPGKTPWVSQILIAMEVMFLKRERGVFSYFSMASNGIFFENMWCERCFFLGKLRMKGEVRRCMCLTGVSNVNVDCCKWGFFRLLCYLWDLAKGFKNKYKY